MAKSIYWVFLLSIIISCKNDNSKAGAMNIEIYYFEGCPTYIETAENLKFVLNDLWINSSFKMVEVKSAEEAISKKFMGSPTVRVDGTDIEEREGDYVFGCRIYNIDGQTTGTPTKAFLKSKIISYLKKNEQIING